MPEQLFLRSFLSALGALLLVSAAAACAQENAAAGAQQPTTVLHASTQLVIVDVAVQDSDGKPVHGLTRDNFQIVEDKTAQTTLNFEEHRKTPSSGVPQRKLQLPSGTFTDYTPVKPDSTLNVILLDSLNTPITGQSYVRDQLKKYVAQAPGNAQIAIFGLNGKLTMLQGFTSDPNVLKDAVEHKLAPRASMLLDDPVGSNVDSNKVSSVASELATETGSGALALVAANLSVFETGASTVQLNLRITSTMNAFEALAHYLSGFPGRKNLIWFSGSFPFNVQPEVALQNPYAMTPDGDRFREVSNLLTRARVAVYPVDARGLMAQPSIDPSRSGDTTARNPSSFNSENLAFVASQASEHATMQQLADDTGGHAFYSTNGLAQAVNDTIETGSDYYTLVYSPADHGRSGAYRSIRVELAGNAPHPVKLMYRHGYFSDSPGKEPSRNVSAPTTPTAAGSTSASTPYARTALSHGAPTPGEVVFRVRILPASTGTEDALASGNTATPESRGPYRRYLVDFTALANSFSWKVDANGHRLGEATFETLVFNPDGSLLNGALRNLKFDLPAETYNVLLKEGMNLHLEISAPAKGESFLRVAVQDVPSNRFGVVEVPTSSVKHLEPPAAAPPAAAAPPH